MRRLATSKVAFLFIALWLVGCAGYAGRIQEPRRLYEAGNFDASAEMLKKLAEKNDNDRLLYLMDLGMVYHAAGKYPQAIKAFLSAEKLADSKDFTSISQEVGSVVTNDDAKFYGGEDFEKILINVYLAIDYTLSGNAEDALVECRKVNHKLDQMIQKGQKTAERNAFAKYLAAALFESEGDWNAAFVDYRQLRKWNASVPFLAAPLLRIAERMQATQELEEYKKEYPEEKDYKLDKKHGEVVVIVEQGRAPVKMPSHQMSLVPVFVRRNYGSREVIVRDVAKPENNVRSRPLFDIEATAVRELDAKLAEIVAKKMAGVVAKHAVGYGVEKATDSKLAGLLTTILLRATDKADLRSWTTLPAKLHIARLKVPAGRRDIELDMVDASGGIVKGANRWQGVEVKPGKITFLSYRTLQ